MKASETLIRDVIRAADGKIVGRIRLQKIFYILDANGLNISNAEFHYHHYGPYSRVLDETLEKAKALAGVSEAVQHRAADGAPFSVFTVKSSGAMPVKIGDLEMARVKALIGIMTKNCTSTVLELAATIHWLTTVEKVPNWRQEIVRRKGAKTANGRLDEAVDLLPKLGLAVPAST